MAPTSPSSDMIGQGVDKTNDASAFALLASLPPGTDKNTLISTIDNAVDVVLSDLSAHESGDLDPETLMRVQTSLTFLEQCLAFKDQEFTSFAKKRANELQTALTNTVARIQEAKQKELEAAKAAEEAKKPKPEAEPKKAEPAKPAAKPSAEEAEEDTGDKGFPYEREERILIDYAYELFRKRLAFLQGDTIKVVKQKQVMESGINQDGVPPIFFLAPEFQEIIRQPFIDLIVEKRDLFERRVYVHTDKDDTDEHVKALYADTYRRDIMGIIALGFDNWAGEMTQAGIAGLPQEQRAAAPKKKEEQGGGIGSSLKKVFSFGKKEEPKKKAKKAIPEDRNPVRIHKEWQKLENKGVLNLSQHFSFSMLSYILNMSEKQFDTEYECISQIVNQQEDPDVGPVVTNLSRLYKFYDNIFFDLCILVLFQRKNKFDINMLQAACMSQNFVVDRLPLTMDELRRRPMEHAKNVIKSLKDMNDKKRIEQALTDYFYVHETVHASKVGKRIQASENTLKRHGDKASGNAKMVIEACGTILTEIETFKARQEEEGVYLGEEIKEAIASGIKNTIARL